MLTTQLLRERFLSKILERASQKEREQKIGTLILQKVALGNIEYKHCQKLAELMDWEANSIARLFGINESFPATKMLNPHSENKILQFLGEKNMQSLEKKLILEVAINEIERLLQSMK
ncbi:MAG: hypothetical protein RMJ97_09175 [Raineya sp.]|nr:hypothetical protein [Raineya sp.]MDW8297037.1 hypothetical protein [Raineya sp.]